MGLILTPVVGGGGGGTQNITRTAIAVGDSPYTVLSSDYLIGCDTSGGAITIGLPAAATAGAGTIYIAKDETGDAALNNVIIDPNGTETIDGGLTIRIDSDYDSISFYTDGSNWFIF